MSSPAFLEWYAARKELHPVPADPYRAYMIDLSLRARVAPREVWSKATMWTDVPWIDFPRGMPAPKPRRGRPSLKPYKQLLTSARLFEEKPLTPAQQKLKKEILSMKERFLAKYHLPDVDVEFEPKAPSEIGAYWRGEIGISKPVVRLGLMGGLRHRPEILATAGHELGHHVGYYRGYAETGHVASDSHFVMGRIQKEREAWKFADPFLIVQRPAQKWVKKTALGTYLGTTRNVREIKPAEFRKLSWARHGKRKRG